MSIHLPSHRRARSQMPLPFRVSQSSLHIRCWSRGVGHPSQSASADDSPLYPSVDGRYSKRNIRRRLALKTITTTPPYNVKKKKAKIIGNVELKEADLQLKTNQLMYDLSSKQASYTSRAFIESTKSQNTLKIKELDSLSFSLLFINNSENGLILFFNCVFFGFISFFYALFKGIPILCFKGLFKGFLSFV